MPVPGTQKAVYDRTTSIVTATPVLVTAGVRTVDVSVVPFMRYLPIKIQARNLKPFANANVWMDSTKVNQWTQVCNYVQANTGFSVNVLSQGEGLFCNTTHAYAQVVEYSAGGILYIDDNYTVLNLTPYGPTNSNTFTKTSFNVGDIVYQTSNNAANVAQATYIGQVVYWQNACSALVLTTTQGTFGNGATSNVLFKSGVTALANVVNIVYGDRFPLNAAVTSTLNVNAIFTVNAQNHYAGVVPFTTGIAANQIEVSGNLKSNVVNSQIYITCGGGIGQNSKIISITQAAGGGTRCNVTPNLVNLAGNSFYSIGNVIVDGIGLTAAICRVPEDAALAFPTGNRLLTINDGQSANDNTATMYATATFVAAGQLIVDQSVATTPGVPVAPQQSGSSGTTVAPSTPTSTGINNNSQSNNPTALAQPLVQTFFTPKPTDNQIDNGIFVTSVNLFFADSPSGSATQFPVDVYIVETNNGYPTATILGVASVRWEDIHITDGVTTFPNTQNSATATKFTFPDPVYLSPGTEYGIVVYSESPDYDVWVGEINEPVINSTRLASSPPYVGSFYIAQNASQWNPIQNQMLMFVVNKAQFTTTPATLFFQVTPIVQNTYIDQLILHSSDLTLPPCNIQYAVQTTVANSGANAGFVTVQKDTPYSFGSDLTNSLSAGNRRRVVQAGNNQSMTMQVVLSTSDPDVSPFFHSEALNILGFTNVINQGGIDPNDIVVVNPGNHINAANIIVTIDAPTGDLAIQAVANVKAANLSGNSLLAINIINPGAGYIQTPNITITEPGAPTNATVVVAGETGISGGNMLTRYVTRPLTLANGFNAGDLVVYMDIIRPQGTDVRAYYKVLSPLDTQTIQQKTWQLFTLSNDIFSPDQQTPVALTFNTGNNIYGIPNGSVAYTANGITYPIGGTFSTYMIKIVTSTLDPTVPPVVLDYRSVAVPAG